MSAEKRKFPAPARKIFISQLKCARLVSSSERTKHNDPNLFGKYVVNLGDERLLYFTNVWIQGCIENILHDDENKTVIRLHDGTGVVDVFGMETIVSRNWFLEKKFAKGMQVMVTGVVLLAGDRIPCIQAFRISELHGCTRENWISQVEELQDYLVHKVREAAM